MGRAAAAAQAFDWDGVLGTQERRKLREEAAQTARSEVALAHWSSRKKLDMNGSEGASAAGSCSTHRALLHRLAAPLAATVRLPAAPSTHSFVVVLHACVISWPHPADEAKRLRDKKQTEEFLQSLIQKKHNRELSYHEQRTQANRQLVQVKSARAWRLTRLVTFGQCGEAHVLCPPFRADDSHTTTCSRPSPAF